MTNAMAVSPLLPDDYRSGGMRVYRTKVFRGGFIVLARQLHRG
jgi:hypothetical protein